MPDIAAHYLDDALVQLRKLKALADGALAQTDDAAFFHAADAQSNSIALLCKHVAGNMRSRWTDFLTTDGEKADRRRDTEFERSDQDSRARLAEAWEQGWALTLATIGALTPADLPRVVTVRGEPHSVLQAIQRQLTHYAYHVGQIVQLARDAAGPRWRSLSIPRGQSAQYEVSRTGQPFGIRTADRTP